MKAEIIAVGTEILLGNIVNTNAQFLSQQLSDIGIDVYFQSVVGDNVGRLEEQLKLSLARADLVITTGGLGPTMDDLTKETVADYFHLPMQLHQESLDKIQTFFKQLGCSMTKNNVKQAYFPQGCIIMSNERGTAPGCIVEQEGKTVIVLPGPPYEMKGMFRTHVLPYLKAKSDFKMESRMLRVFGIGESALEDQIHDLLDAQTNPTIALYAGFGEVKIRLTAKCGRDADAAALFAPVEAALRARLGDAIYTVGDASLSEVTARMLIDSGKTIALAESCTGGLIAAALIDTPGISASLLESHVTYSNAAKMRVLGVAQATLDAHGAVSEQTAREMAQGLLAASGADLSLSVTGIAGPDGGMPEKPVGLVYLALCDTHGVCEIKRLQQTGNRSRIRNSAKLNALNMIRLYLQKNAK
nr:competence/damage-inducible protein A [Maliibacterium massiliense]